MNSAFLFPNLGTLTGLLMAIPTGGLVRIVSYVFTGIALYTMAERRGIKNAWFAWIPVLNMWILGSLSDQYRYVVRGEVRNRRKLLLILEISAALLGLVIAGIGIWLASYWLVSGFWGVPEYRLLQDVTGPVVALCGLAVPLLGVKCAQLLFSCMALYDVYASCDPENAVLFLVLSLVARITKPFFLFFSREKEKGMPPRRRTEQPAGRPDPDDNSVYGVIL